LKSRGKDGPNIQARQRKAKSHSKRIIPTSLPGSRSEPLARQPEHREDDLVPGDELAGHETTGVPGRRAALRGLGVAGRGLSIFGVSLGGS
jgi:hypothetical protein